MEAGLNVFFDTEFTNINPHATPGLISIGCVTNDGREFYAELSDTYQAADCSDFVILNVLPLLSGGEFCMTSEQAAGRLQKWVESLGGEEVIFRTDAPSYDWAFVAELFRFYGCWPSNLRRKYGTVYFDTDYQASIFQEASEVYWKANPDRQHHALEDARCMRSAWNVAINGGKDVVDEPAS